MCPVMDSKGGGMCESASQVGAEIDRVPSRADALAFSAPTRDEVVRVPPPLRVRQYVR